MRDGTKLQRPTYVDGQWVRFYQDRPRKMMGYQEQQRKINGIVRNFNIFNAGGFANIHVSSGNAIQRYAVQLVSGAATTATDRSPAGYVPNVNNLWSTTTMTLPAGTAQIYAVATPTLMDITTDVASQVYQGDPSTNALLTNLVDTGAGALGNMTCTGGVLGVAPYLMLYGQTGLIQWSVPGKPTNFSDAGASQARVCSDRIVYGLPLRGQSAPAAIFWSLSSLIVGNFTGGANFWSFTTVSTTGSILSAASVVEHNGIFYWASTSGFARFTGVMDDIPNEYNRQYFLDNLNYAQRQKVFAFKVPRWNEIWWCFPFGSATECNYAIIYNYVKNYWYDTPLPNGGRSAGTYDVTYHFPLMAGVTTNSDTGGTSIWQHEIGFDEVSGPLSTPKAILAFVETHELNITTPQQQGAVGQDKSLSFSILEPDFDQTGDLLLQVYSRANARAQFVQMTDVTIPAVITDPSQQLVEFKWTGRQTSFLIESNALGGNFVWGAPLIHAAPADGRRTG